MKQARTLSNKSVLHSIQIKIAVIIAITLALIITGYSAFDYLTNKHEMTSELNELTEVIIKRLQKDLATPLYDFNDKGVEEILLSEMMENSLYAILVRNSTGDQVLYGKTRNAEWKATDTDTDVAGEDYIVKTADIKKADEDLGIAEIYVTPKFIKERLMDKLTSIVVTNIVTLGVILIAIIVSIRRIIIKPVNRVMIFAEKLKQGDLTDRLPVSRDEIGKMGEALNAVVEGLDAKADIAAAIAKGDLRQEVTVMSDKDKLGEALVLMVKSLSTTIRDIQMSGEQVASGSAQVADSSQSLSQGATEQTVSLQQIVTSMGEIGERTQTNAENASQAEQLVKSVSDSGRNGMDRIREMETAMNDISESSREIEKIIKAIDDIAFQTNLLALNAAVEAARAGKYGKGFAVVAQEVRALAARSAKAASETAELIEGAVKKVDDGSSVAEKTVAALEDINVGVVKLVDFIGEITSASNEQAQKISQINEGLSQIDGVTHQNSALAEEASSVAEQLSSQAAMVRQLLTRFKLSDTTDITGRPTQQAAAASPTPATSPKVVAHEDEWGKPESQRPSANDQAVDPRQVISLDEGDFGKY